MSPVAAVVLNSDKRLNYDYDYEHEHELLIRNFVISTPVTSNL